MPRDGRREARGAPKPRPSVEIWLDSVSPSTTTKPSPEELRQWDLDDRGNSGRSFFLTTVVLRATSLIAALAVVIVCLTIIAPLRYSTKDLVPTLIACFVTAAWDAAEFGIMYARGGQGLPWWSHIAADGAIFIAIAIASGLIHFSLVVFFLFAYVRGRAQKQKTEPRIMYLPTGDPVVVTREPIVPPAATAPSPKSPTPPPSPGTADSIHEPFRQGVPPRKPVAGAPTRTPYASPWPGPGPNYQPDEAELARAARGELQAQCMMVQAKGLRHEKVAMENATARAADQRSPNGQARA
ncbi:hypothetical protein B0T18DRAFT_386673 [Schizothecium vesticola]|uniref:MARVEL domain-containing protein n=1 Tax=Schizothecium vesticola TaxID=314040 RepID=A0AA40FBR0_9PEZI|nr:hypothetical protein B0T18DRAFT_386673 [Schizothecium vesticola]